MKVVYGDNCDKHGELREATFVDKLECEIRTMWIVWKLTEPIDPSSAF